MNFEQHIKKRIGELEDDIDDLIRAGFNSSDYELKEKLMLKEELKQILEGD